MNKKFLKQMWIMVVAVVMIFGANTPLSYAGNVEAKDENSIIVEQMLPLQEVITQPEAQDTDTAMSKSVKAGSYIEGQYIMWHAISQWPKFGVVFSEYEYYDKVLGRPGGTHGSLLKVGDSFTLPLAISGTCWEQYYPNGDSGAPHKNYNLANGFGGTLDANKWTVTNSNVLKITKNPDSVKIDCVGVGSSYLRYTAPNMHGTWKDVVVNVSDNPTMPKIISTNISDVKTSVEVKYSDGATGCQVGWSLLDDVGTVDIWKAGNPAGTVLSELPTDVTIFVFVRDAENNTVSKNAGSIPGILTMPLNQGATIQLVASYDFSNNANLIWSSSDAQVATVDGSGNVTGIDKGIAYITAKNASNTFNKSIPVRVMTSVPKPEEGLPRVTEVQITEQGAKIIGTDDKGIVEYGLSATTDSSTATWKKSNVFSNVKPGAVYYAFVKDGDGNISEPFAFTKPAE